MVFSIERQTVSDIALIEYNGSSVTYGQLAEFVPIWQENITANSLLFLFCENSIGSLKGYIAALDSHTVPLLLSVSIDEKLRDTLINTYHPQFLWMPEKMEKSFSFPCIFRDSGYCLLKTDFLKYALHQDLALLMSTSGSTGSPKLVRQSLHNLESNAQSIANYLQINKEERAITSLPMSYVYGLSVINSHLLKGATLLLTNCGLMQKEFWSFFKEQNATSIAGVPYTYEMLKRLRIMSMELPTLKTLTQAGGKLLPDLHREYAQWAKETGRRFFVMYGASEATARMGYLPPERSLEKYGSMGIAIPGGIFWLEDDDGQRIKTTETPGELVYCGANVVLGYAECRDDLNKGDEMGGILYTGDIAVVDDDGYYTIVGRKKRFLKINGLRVGLDETECIIKNEFDLDCACVGTDDHLTVFITQGEPATVRTFIAEKTGIYFAAFTVKLIDEIPKNDSGKTLYHKLEALI